ncbi:MAG: protein kinase [Planctomycetales bacterium]|nr:protein kinase [Planctomycetales bacterium]
MIPLNQAVGSTQETELRLACQEVRQQISSGHQEQIAECVLARFPLLQNNTEAEIEVIYAEFDARSMQQVVQRETFYKRFPQHRERLARLFHIHDVLGNPGTSGMPEGRFDTPTQRSDTLSALPEMVASAETETPHFENYTIIHEIARGGMGVVYQARDNRLGRMVAIKTLRSSDFDPWARRHLIKEATAAAKLQHANVVQVFEVGESDEGPFCIMEWVPGGTLEKVTQQRTLTATEAAQMLLKIASAIAYAHQHGIIHRDLKPGNILLTHQGEPKVADFGLAKMDPHVPADCSEANQDPHTRTGAIVGTPSYMAPEQAEGRMDQIGPAADVYSLGAILYESLTSRPPFLGSSTLETLGLVVSADAVSPSKLHAHLPRDLESICLKCLAKKSHQRYAAVEDLAADLRRFLDGKPTVARPISRLAKGARWCRRYPAVSGLLTALVASLLLGFAGIGWQWQAAARQAEIARTQKDAAETGRRQAEQQKVIALQQKARADHNLATAQQVVEQFSQIGARYAQNSATEGVGRELLEESLQYYWDIMDLDSNDNQVRYSTALAHHRAARILNDLGRWEDAAQTSHKAVRLFSDLHLRDPHHVDYAFWLLECSFQYADGLRGRGQTVAASHAFATAAGQGEQFVQKFPDELRLQSLLSVTLINWRTFLDKDSPEAVATLQRAIELQEAVVRVDPHGIWPLQDLAQGKDNLAADAWRRGELTQAVFLYEEALALRQKIQAQNPRDPMHQLYLARNLTFLAQVLDRQQQFDCAANRHEAARQVLTQLEQDMQHAYRFRSERIKSDAAFTYHLLSSPRLGELPAHFQASLDRITSMANEWPDGNRFPRIGVDLIRQVLDGLNQADHLDVASECKQIARPALQVLFNASSPPASLADLDDNQLRHAIYMSTRFRTLAIRLQLPTVVTKSTLQLAGLQSVAAIRRIPKHVMEVADPILQADYRIER